MKTAITVLQELMVKLGETPDYECISQLGPQHLAMFEFRCVARGVTVTAAARSKKEAKQEAARRMLLELAARGHAVPPPYGAPAADPCASGDISRLSIAGSSGMEPVAAAAAARSYVALLKELCEEYRLPGVEYELVGDTGPPHCRQFTMQARVSQHKRLATATTKKAARQIAAEQLYTYLRENLSKVTKDFCEEEALVRVHEKAMQRYSEERPAGQWRPDLGQRLADYHLGLRTHVDEDKQAAAREALTRPGPQDEERLRAVAAALGLELALSAAPAESGELWLAEMERAEPPIACAATSRRGAVQRAITHLRLALAVDH